MLIFVLVGCALTAADDRIPAEAQESTGAAGSFSAACAASDADAFAGQTDNAAGFPAGDLVQFIIIQRL